MCSKRIAIPALGFKEAVRVCDTCHAQLEAGDPVCLSKEVSRLRDKEPTAQQQGLKALAEWAAFDPQFAAPALIQSVKTLSALQRLAELLGSGSPVHVQGAAVKLLAAMAHYEAYLPALAQTEPSLMQPALALVQSRRASTEARTHACRAVALLLDHDSLRRAAVSLGATAALSEVLMEQSCPDAQLEWVCGALTRLCADDESAAREVARAGAAFVLAPALASPSAATQEEAAALLSIIAAVDADARTQAAESGGLAHVVGLLRSRNAQTRDAGLGLARELARSSRCASALVDAGAAAPLAQVLGQTQLPAEFLTEAIQLLLALGGAGGGALKRVQAAVRESSGVPALTQLMSSPDSALRSAAMRAVSELSAGDSAATDSLRESGGVVLLSESLLSPDEQTALQAVSTIAQMSASAQHVSSIIDNNCLSPLLQLLSHRSAAVRSEAELAFSNLARSGAINSLLLHDPSASKHLVSLLRRSGGVMQSQAAIAIAGIANDARARETLFAQGALPQLVALLGADPELAGAAVQAVAHFASDERFRGTLAELGVSHALATQLSHRSPDVARCALSAVANLSFVESGIPALAAAGVPMRLGELLFGADDATLHMLLAALCNIGAADPSDAGTQLLQVGGALGLVTLLNHRDTGLQAQAALLIGQLAQCAPFAQAVGAADATKLLAALLHSPTLDVQMNAVYALGILSGQDDAAARAVEATGAITSLTRMLLGTGEPDSKRRATLALANVVRGQWRQVYNMGGFAALLVALNVGTDAVQQEVSREIANLASDPTHRRALLSDVSSVSSIVGILSSENPSTQTRAAEAVLAFAEEEAAREVLYSMGIVGQLIRLLTVPAGSDGAAQPDGRAALVGTLAHFAADPRYCDTLRITMCAPARARAVRSCAAHAPQRPPAPLSAAHR